MILFYKNTTTQVIIRANQILFLHRNRKINLNIFFIILPTRSGFYKKLLISIQGLYQEIFALR